MLLLGLKTAAFKPSQSNRKTNNQVLSLLRNRLNRHRVS